MNILVTGGAGYIGSHMVQLLHKGGYKAVVLDNLSQGHRDAVTGGELIVGEVGDPALLDSIFTTQKIAAVMHFAGSIQVGESVANPGKYYANNLAQTLLLFNAMVRHGVKRFIFSSTAAIFGNPSYVPIDEAHPRAPINPYGWSKYMVEQLLADFDRAYGLRSVCLRYFNACGADPEGHLGERHDPETHLVPLVLQAASGRRKDITIFGRDYATPDGTCIRDYVHICDLCDAHLLALKHLLANSDSRQYNLGNGKGFSVAEVIGVAEKVTGKAIERCYGPRREGDPASLVADASLIRRELAWKPNYGSLETIIQHAWAWERKSTKHRAR